MADFGHAVKIMKEGFRVYRRQWGGGRWVQLQVPDEHSLMTEPYLYMANLSGATNKIPWLPSHADILADDWAAL